MLFMSPLSHNPTLFTGVKKLIDSIPESARKEAFEYLHSLQGSAAPDVPPRTPATTPIKEVPAPDAPPTPKMEGPLRYTRTTREGKLKIGEFSTQLDPQIYTTYEAVAHTKTQNTNDGLEHFTNAVETAQYVTNPAVLSATQTQFIGMASLMQYAILRDGATSFHQGETTALTHFAGPTGNRVFPINVAGEPRNLNEFVTFPSDHHFMADPQLTTVSRRQIPVLSNVYRVNAQAEFTTVHQLITQRTQKTDVTLAYVKRWLTYYSLLGQQAVLDYSNQQPGWVAAANSALALVGIPATTIHYDANNEPGVPNTIGFLTQVTTNHATGFYAKPGTPASYLICDAIGAAPYPVWDITADLQRPGPPAGPQPAAQQIRVHANQIRFTNDVVKPHLTYTLEEAVFQHGVVQAVAQNPRPLAFPAQPPNPEILRRDIFNIAQETDEYDSMINALMIAAQLIFERSQPNPPAAYNSGVFNGLLDFDVLTIPYSNPIYRVAQAFNAHAAAPPVPPNARILISSAYPHKLEWAFYLGAVLSYGRSVALNYLNFSGSELHQLPLRQRGAQHQLTADRAETYFPEVNLHTRRAKMAALTAKCITGLFGFTLPMGHEMVLSRYMDAPAANRTNRLQTAGLTTPFLVQGWQLIRLLLKTPAETGIFDASTAVNFQRCLKHNAHATVPDEILTRMEVSDYWQSAMTLCTPTILAAQLIRSQLLGIVAPNHHIDNIQITSSMNQGNATRVNGEFWQNHNFAGVLPDGDWPPRLEFLTVTSDFSAPVPVFRTYSVTTNNPVAVGWRARLHAMMGPQYKAPYYYTYKWIDFRSMTTRNLGAVHPLPGPALDLDDSVFEHAQSKRPRIEAISTAPPTGVVSVADVNNMTMRPNIQPAPPPKIDNLN